MKVLTAGREAVVFTERGTEVRIRYAVVELSEIIASHNSALRINKRYPAELQPRDRTRLASEDQVQRIVKGLKPELLAESVKASDGAPITGDEGFVESGNVRTIALMRFYAAERAGKYRRHLVSIAASLELNAKAIKAAKRPVLIRIRLTEVDRIVFAQECNEQNVAAMSAAEQARLDAEKLDVGLLSLFEPDENGNLATASNRDFIRAFIDRAVAPGEHGRYIDRKETCLRTVCGEFSLH